MQIAAIQTATNQSVSSITQIGTTIETISTIAGAISASVGEQQSAIEEIALNVQEAARGTHEVSSNIAGVSQAASETGTTSTFVLTAANALTEQTDKIRHEVTGLFRHHQVGLTRRADFGASTARPAPGLHIPGASCSFPRYRSIKAGAQPATPTITRKRR